MKKGKLAEMLAAMAGTVGLQHLVGSDIYLPGKRNKTRRPRTKEGYKPAFSMGFRGSPRSETRPGSMTCPTIDQVRNIERRYGQRIHVKQGIMYFKTDGIMFTREEATKRAADDLENRGTEVCHG